MGAEQQTRGAAELTCSTSLRDSRGVVRGSVGWRAGRAGATWRSTRAARRRRRIRIKLKHTSLYSLISI